MLTSFEQKQEAIRLHFSEATTPEQVYTRIIDLGRRQQPLLPEQRTEPHRVHGCQSTMYLVAHLQDGRILFEAESDALISAGLAQLLIWAYSGEKPEVVLTSPPVFLKELAIPASLSPSRANGLASLHLKMQQEALFALRGC